MHLPEKVMSAFTPKSDISFACTFARLGRIVSVGTILSPRAAVPLA